MYYDNNKLIKQKNMQDNSSEKELFKKLLENKNIKLSEKDFNQSYMTYLNFRKI